MTLKIFPTLPRHRKQRDACICLINYSWKSSWHTKNSESTPPERHVIYGRSLRHLENVRLNFGVDFGNECIILWFWFVEFIKSVHISEFSSKDMIQIFVFWNYLLLRIKTLESPNQKTKLDRMFIFFLGFFLSFSFWPIKSANLQNSGFQSKIWTGWQFYKYLIYQFFNEARSKLKNSKSRVQWKLFAQNQSLEYRGKSKE